MAPWEHRLGQLGGVRLPLACGGRERDAVCDRRLHERLSDRRCLRVVHEHRSSVQRRRQLGQPIFAVHSDLGAGSAERSGVQDVRDRANNVSVVDQLDTFGAQPVGTESAAQAVTVTNVATGPSLSVDAVKFTALDADQFKIAYDKCSGQTLAAGASCLLSIRSVPAAVGAATAAVQITSNSLSSPDRVSLSGTGTAPPPPPQGPQGPTGSQGQTGSQGVAGPTGPQGLAGAAGASPVSETINCTTKQPRTVGRWRPAR